MPTMQASLYDREARAVMVRRIQALNEHSPRQWGKMTPAQMLAHCRVGLEVALGDRRLKRVLLGLLLGRLAKRTALGDRPMPHNLPTGAEFRIADPQSLELERRTLLRLIERFAQGPSAVTRAPHPFFGELSAQEWDRLQWRHLDHHLGQFGV